MLILNVFFNGKDTLTKNQGRISAPVKGNKIVIYIRFRKK